jgi:hypothetical protein
MVQLAANRKMAERRAESLWAEFQARLKLLVGWEVWNICLE